MDTAAEYGLYIGLLPTWGYHVSARKAHRCLLPSHRPGRTRHGSPALQGRPNMIWINGGDVVGDEHGEPDVEIWKAIGRRTRRTVPGTW